MGRVFFVASVGRGSAVFAGQVASITFDSKGILRFTFKHDGPGFQSGICSATMKLVAVPDWRTPDYNPCHLLSGVRGYATAYAAS